MAVHDSMAAVAEHSMVKATTPFIIAFLIGAVSWMFSSVIDLQNQMTLLSEGKFAHLEEKLDALSLQVEKTMKKGSLLFKITWYTPSFVVGGFITYFILSGIFGEL
jgi:hypothetical protein